jgi:hypothetical protein
MKMDLEKLVCDACGKELQLENTNKAGIYVMFKLGDELHVYFACKGRCDDQMKKEMSALGGESEGWLDCFTLLNPAIWISKNVAVMNGLNAGEKYEKNSWKKLKNLFITTFTTFTRDLTKEEEKEFETDLMLRGM